MRNKAYAVMVFLAIFVISGCGTVPKKYNEEVSGIKSRVDTLESRVDNVESKQSDVERMANEQAQKMEELEAAGTRRRGTSNISVKPRSVKTRTKTRTIQTCLKNAGFYEGKIDGIKGKKTKKAIRDFQKANDLVADGVVGPKTWEILRAYASDTGGLQEGAK